MLYVQNLKKLGKAFYRFPKINLLNFLFFTFVSEISTDGKRAYVRPRDTPIYWKGFFRGPPFSIQFLDFADLNARVTLDGNRFLWEDVSK